MKRRFLSTTEREAISIAIVVLCAFISTPSFGLENSTGPNGSNVQAVWTAGTGYTGQGISVGLISIGHARLTHEAFTGIDPNNWYDATNPSATNPTLLNHDTSAAGIVCSRGGTLHPNDKGAAPGAELYSIRVSTYPTLVDGLSYLLGKCQVVVTPVEVDLTANGTSDWSLIYDYYAYEHNLIFATASGNGDSEISVMGDTYNSITTGGLLIDSNNIYYQVGSTSNPGPTADERQKPDIVAPSENQMSPTAGGDATWDDASPSSGGQTSWAAPQTGGVAAVLLSYANSPESSESNDNQNEVIKAVIVNSAFPNILDKTGSPTVNPTDPNDLSWVWNEDRGYGRIDALRAFEILSNPGITTAQSKGWAYDSVAPDQEDTYTIYGIKNERLVVTLAWNRRVVWNDQNSSGIIEENELEAFLADLDLQIYDPDDYINPITPKFSDIDNLEKFDLLLTKTGNYKIKVVNPFESESANYALAFELLEPLPADFEVDYVINTEDLALLAQYWLNTGCVDPVPCYLYDLSDNGTIDLSDFSVFSQAWMDFDPRYYSP